MSEIKNEIKMSENETLPLLNIPLSMLPSRGVSYPEGTKIEYRTYTFGEVKKSSISSKDIVSSMKLALSCLTITGMEKMMLSVMDIFYIGLLMKASSLGGEKFNLPFLCPNCGERGNVVLTQSDIEFKELDKRVVSLPIEAEIDGKRLKFGLMTVKQFIDLHSGVYNAILKEGKPDAVSAYAMLNKSMSFKEAYDFIYNLKSAEDAETIDEIDKALLHNLLPVETKCAECDSEIFVKMEGKEALLQPFRDGERANRPRVFFQSAPAHTSNESLPDGICDSDGTSKEA